jgi:hypothetical protein
VRALVGLAVAVAVLVVGALPAIALVLDDGDGSGHGYGHAHGPAGMHGHDRMHGPLSPAARRCLRAVPDPEGSGRSTAPRAGGGDDSRDGVPQWREKNLRTFAHCLRLLQRAAPPGSEG